MHDDAEGEQHLTFPQDLLGDELALVCCLDADAAKFAAALTDCIVSQGIAATLLEDDALQLWWPADADDAGDIARGTAVVDAQNLPAIIAVVLTSEGATMDRGRRMLPKPAAKAIIEALADRDDEDLVIVGGLDSGWLATDRSNPAAAAAQVIKARNGPISAVKTVLTADLLLFRLYGEMDMYSAREGKDRIVAGLGEALAADVTAVVVDLRHVTFLDSTWLGVMVSLAKRIRPKQLPCNVIVPDPNLRRIFEVTGLDRIFPIIEAEDDIAAIAASVVRRPRQVKPDKEHAGETAAAVERRFTRETRAAREETWRVVEACYAASRSADERFDATEQDSALGNLRRDQGLYLSRDVHASLVGLIGAAFELGKAQRERQPTGPARASIAALRAELQAQLQDAMLREATWDEQAATKSAGRRMNLAAFALGVSFAVIFELVVQLTQWSFIVDHPATYALQASACAALFLTGWVVVRPGGARRPTWYVPALIAFVAVLLQVLGGRSV